MTDAPAPTAAPDPAASPNSYAGPLWLVAIPALITTVKAILDQAVGVSESIKLIAGNLNVGWALPYLAGVLSVILAIAPLIGGAVWLYRRGLSLRHPFALWFKSMMPWNRAA